MPEVVGSKVDEACGKANEGGKVDGETSSLDDGSGGGLIGT